jgi:hypothetical protein
MPPEGGHIVIALSVWNSVTLCVKVYKNVEKGDICHPMVTSLVKRYKTLINENYNTSSEEVAPENKGKKSCI